MHPLFEKRVAKVSKEIEETLRKKLKKPNSNACLTFKINFDDLLISQNTLFLRKKGSSIRKLLGKSKNSSSICKIKLQRCAKDF